jgi:hypothetical protein
VVKNELVRFFRIARFCFGNTTCQQKTGEQQYQLCLNFKSRRHVFEQLPKPYNPFIWQKRISQTFCLQNVYQLTTIPSGSGGFFCLSKLHAHVITFQSEPEMYFYHLTKRQLSCNQYLISQKNAWLKTGVFNYFNSPKSANYLA